MSNILRQRLEAGQSVYADHPSADTLAAFIEHGLKSAERDKVLGHLSACSECRQAVLLAVPEVAEAVRVQAPHSSPWYFPTAMRWASLTAAVAVAVGVGMISYEHEFRARSSTPSSVEPPKIATAQREVANEQRSETAAAPRSQTTLQDSLSKDQPKPAGLREPQISELKKTTSAPSRRDADKAKALELDQKAEASNVSPSALGIVSAQEQETGKNEAGLTKQQNPASANFASGEPIQQPQLNSRNEALSLQAAASAPLAAPTPASPAASARKADSSRSASNAVQPKSEDFSIAQSVTSESGPGYFDAKTPMPAKVPGFSAVNGSVKKSAAAVTEFASWTVTAAGKLQRHLRNGAVNFIEPAPGLIVHAVASRGIEVWAGGSQPDAPKQGPQSALFHSSDAGESWKQVNGPWHGPINQLALSGPDTLTVVTDDGTWVSKDAGGSWTNR